MGIEVVAQGIETKQQLEALTRMGCEVGQGNLLSLPVEPARATIQAGLGRWSLVTEA
jgi:EAL domain-containing protein (putative c-di-GMP-specific phosphodiesterase class I)